jgi:hypothetical protein
MYYITPSVTSRAPRTPRRLGTWPTSSLYIHTYMHILLRTYKYTYNGLELRVSNIFIVHAYVHTRYTCTYNCLELRVHDGGLARDRHLHYIYMHTHIHICTYTIHITVPSSAFTEDCTWLTYWNVCMHACMYVRIYDLYVCMYVRLYACMYSCMYVCTPVCVYVCM